MVFLVSLITHIRLTSILNTAVVLRATRMVPKTRLIAKKSWVARARHPLQLF